MLWFAFILLSLSYWQQRTDNYSQVVDSCDLLSFYYLCRTDNNSPRTYVRRGTVVICFHFTIFVVLTTTRSLRCGAPTALWFAFILLSLSYWQQLQTILTLIQSSCDLLSFYYLCRTDNNERPQVVRRETVVICFHFTIFVVLTTTKVVKGILWVLLWFAFILLSLSYWQQQKVGQMPYPRSCDLLSFYYLCRTDNNWLL